MRKSISKEDLQRRIFPNMLTHQGRIQTFVQEGAPTPSRGRLPNILIKFTGKPYEIKEILVRRGGASRERPP